MAIYNSEVVRELLGDPSKNLLKELRGLRD
jgi:hypothetical protein